MVKKIPIFLISGFLGSGKTTLLKEIYNRNRQRRLVYLINDFSVRDVDATRFSETDADIVSVPGGSIFCTCLVTKFVNQMREIFQRHSTSDTQFEALVIEASGTANPAVISTLLRDTKLDTSFEIHSIISVTDPIALPKLLPTLPNIRLQIAAADRIILNKIDLVTADEIKKIEARIRSINPQAHLEKTTFCKIDWNPISIPTALVNQAGSESAHPPQPKYAKFSIQNGHKLDINLLTTLIKQHPDQFYRIKGFFFDGQQRLIHLDYSISSGLQITPAAVPAEAHIEFIFDGHQADTIQSALRKFHREAFS
ncbi:GTP-binding protein [candidate division KSB1 bacterium]|nr:GTP-binding protein [candidate division KSB1 bacterium]